MKLYKGLIILFVTICLTACQSTEFQFDLEKLKSEVVSAEIVNVYFNDSNEMMIDVVKIIEQTDLDELLEDFSKITFTKLIGDPQIINGNSLKLNHANGYEVVAYNSIFKYSYDNEKIIDIEDIYSPEEFEDFILKWKNRD